MTYDELLARAAAVPYAFPTEANRLARFAHVREEVEEHAAGVRPILDARVLELMDGFLALKRAAGSAVERALYAEMTTTALISRLLRRRPLAFLNARDDYLLRDGARGHGGFELIGGPEEGGAQTLGRLLSYDEMALSALVGVSVPTHFINAGARHNRAVPAEPGSFEPRGIYVGLVGARFERPRFMEARHMLVSEAHTAAAGYGPDADPAAPEAALLRLWAGFYGLEHLPTYAQAAADTAGRFWRLWNGSYLDALVYRRRLRASIEPFLREADARARDAGRPAYVHAVGLGLGVWAIDCGQVEVMVDVYAEVLREVALPHVACVDFSWFDGANACDGARSGEAVPGRAGPVRIRFSRRDPAARLTGEDADHLLVAMYAWDSNAYPGNEYWLGALSASGDPAAACCSTIPELQNPDVNPRVAGEVAAVYGGDGP